MAKKTKPNKKSPKRVQNFDLFSDFFRVPKFWTIFSTFLTFFQMLSWTWGINFDTIACVFEPVYGPKKKLFFRPKFDFLTFFQNDLGIKNFLANRPSLIRTKILPEAKTLIFEFVFSIFRKNFKKIAEIM